MTQHMTAAEGIIKHLLGQAYLTPRSRNSENSKKLVEAIAAIIKKEVTQ